MVMTTYSLSHLSDPAILQNLTTLVVRDRGNTASLLAHLAEVDARRLFAPAGYPSMFEYCVRELRMSEDSAYKRIRAARTAREFPVVLDAVRDGRLHLTAVVLLTPHLTRDTADELLRAATHKSKAEIEQLLAERFPRPDVATRLAPVAPSVSAPTIERASPVEGLLAERAPRPVELHETKLAPEPVAAAPTPARVTPVAPRRFALQVTLDQETHDMLRYAQELLGHQVPSGDVAEVLKRSLQALVAKLEKQRFAATEKPRIPGSAGTNARHIPAYVKRTVWERDRGQCTFVGENGSRCGARRFLEFDHVEPVARGGEATVDGMRLLCRAHNQLEAERAFGAEFMDQKRQRLSSCRG